MKRETRITAAIQLPSVAFQQCLHDAVFDRNVHERFIENPRAVLRAYGVEVPPEVSDEALLELQFAVARARDYVGKEKIARNQFDAVFRLNPLEKPLRSSDWEKTEGFNRGASTDFGKKDAVADYGTDHYTNKSGKGLAKIPLLDVVTLRKLVDHVSGKLKQVGG